MGTEFSALQDALAGEYSFERSSARPYLWMWALMVIPITPGKT
jgi:hypothetical protein